MKNELLFIQFEFCALCFEKKAVQKKREGKKANSETLVFLFAFIPKEALLFEKRSAFFKILTPPTQAAKAVRL